MAVNEKPGVLGPGILARTMSRPTLRGSSKRAWQYHSRSDSHSKLACWTLLFDLLVQCDAIQDAATKEKIGFGINYAMSGPFPKKLDLVVSWDPPRKVRKRRAFSDLASSLGLVLNSAESDVLGRLPPLLEDSVKDISEVAIALEAKACMTEHIKSLPRLHAEILATGYLAKRAAPQCITVSYNLVNAAASFVSPSGHGKPNRHTQPRDAQAVVKMLGTAIPLAMRTEGAYGYDAVGTTVLECRNDNSPVRVVESREIGPRESDHTHYERMVRSVCSHFRARFGRP